MRRSLRRLDWQLRTRSFDPERRRDVSGTSPAAQKPMPCVRRASPCADGAPTSGDRRTFMPVSASAAETPPLARAARGNPLRLRGICVREQRQRLRRRPSRCARRAKRNAIAIRVKTPLAGCIIHCTALHVPVEASSVPPSLKRIVPEIRPVVRNTVGWTVPSMLAPAKIAVTPFGGRKDAPVSTRSPRPCP